MTLKFKRNLPTLLLLVSILLFVLTACNGSDEDAQTEETIALVYTSAAQTMAAQPTEHLPTAAPHAATATLFPTQTMIAQALTQPSPTLAQIVQQPICNEALYMSDVTIPDGTVLTAGESFVKTWLLLNSGACSWDSTYVLGFISGDEMSGVPTVLGESVSSNGQAQLSVTFTAPLTTGSYISYWRMTDGLGTYFGNTIFVSITVSEDATAISTSTNTSASAETYTPTAIPTDTPVP